MIFALLVVVGSSSAPADEPDGNIQQWIKLLGHDSYRTRDKASRELIRLAEHSATRLSVIDALQHAAKHESFEVRAATKEIQNEILDRSRERQIQELLTPGLAAEAIQLPGWKVYSQLAGKDLVARRLFVELQNRYPNVMRVLEGWSQPRTGDQSGSSNFRTLNSWLDPYNTPTEAHGRWALVLCFDICSPQSRVPNRSGRVSLALCQNAIGPKLGTDSNSIVVRRMIGNWIDGQRTSFDRELLMIAMKFGCSDQTNKICERIFADVLAPPSEQTLALLAASKLDRTDLEQEILLRIDNDRVAHVWQLIASRKKKIRTQVRDVAMALLLRSRGIDPRDVGFTELQADQVTIYREHSLGFSDEDTRRKAYHLAAEAMNVSNTFGQ